VQHYKTDSKQSNEVEMSEEQDPDQLEPETQAGTLCRSRDGRCIRVYPTASQSNEYVPLAGYRVAEMHQFMRPGNRDDQR
jgi:hypothetical protein